MTAERLEIDAAQTGGHILASRSFTILDMVKALRIALLVVAVATAACGPSEPLEVTSIQLGKAINPDNTVAAFTTRFKPNDTIYVSVLNAKPGFGTLSVRWMIGNRVVTEGSKRVSYTDAAATEFHLDNTSGFPEGAYRVEILLDGKPVGSRDYRVEFAD